MAEWQLSQANNAYPFVEDGGPIAFDGRPFSDAVADLSLAATATKNLRLTVLSDPAVSPVSITIESDDYTYSATDGVSESFGVWTLVRWERATILVSTARAALHTWPVVDDMLLVPRVYSPSTANVTNFKILVGESFEFDVGVGDVMEIEDGYNLGVSTSDATDIRAATRVKIDAGAGFGKGRFSSCDTTPVLTSLNNMPGKYGKASIQGQDCTHILLDRGDEIYVDHWEPVQGKLVVVDKCEPCCQCDDYVEVYRDGLRPLYEAAKDASDRLYLALAEYNNLRSAFEAAKLCREGLTLEAYAVAKPGWFIQVQVIVKNSTECEEAGPFDLSVIQTDGSALTPYAVVRKHYSGETESIEPVVSGSSTSVTLDEPIAPAAHVHYSFTFYGAEGSGRYVGESQSLAVVLFDGTSTLQEIVTAAFAVPFNK